MCGRGLCGRWRMSAGRLRCPSGGRGRARYVAFLLLLERWGTCAGADVLLEEGEGLLDCYDVGG